MMKRKIGFIGFRTIPHSYGGGEAFIRELAPRLAKKPELDIIVYCRKMFEPKDNLHHEYLGVKKVFIPTIKHKFLETFIHSFLSTLHGILIQRVDIQYFHTLPSAPFCILSNIFGIKGVVNVDGIDWERDKWGKIGKIYLRVAAHLTVKFAALIISDATEIRRIYLQKFNRVSIMIAYGANIEHSTKPELIEKYGLKRDEYYLIACRFVPENNIDLLIQAFNAVKTNKKLLIAGDANYKSKYLEYCKKIAGRNIIFSGHISDQEIIRELHCNAYCYLHGHSLGGTNPALLKALGCGNCILALNTPYNAEVLEFGKYGFLFEKSLKDCIEKLSYIENNNNIRIKYSKIAKDRIKDKYTWDLIIDQYYSVFKSI